MKLYTLTYDCNTPTTQQVNVPTNSDYKVGVKVLRNGKEQSLKPAEVTLGTLSADTDDVNGYTTFTLSAGDNASYTQETLDIQHGYEAGYFKAAFAVQNTTGSTQAITIISADLSDFVGKTIYPKDVYYSGLGNSRSELALSSLEENFGPYWRELPWNYNSLDFKTLIEDKDGNTQIYMIVSQAARDNYINYLGWPKDKPGFFVRGPNNTIAIVENYTVKEGDKLAFGKGYNVSNNRWYGGKLSITAGEPFDAKFKLNTNIFKSQQGDISQAVRANTVLIEGTYSDDEPFSINAVVK